MRRAGVVGTGRTAAEVRLRLGVVGGALAVVAYALTQAVTLPLLPTLLLVCSFGPLLAIGSAGLWELLGLHRRTATLDIGLVANIAAGVAVTLMFLAQLGLKAWFDAGLGGSARQVSPEVAAAAFQAGNGLQPAWNWPTPELAATEGGWRRGGRPPTGRSGRRSPRWGRCA